MELGVDDVLFCVAVGGEWVRYGQIGGLVEVGYGNLRDFNGFCSL